jgi:hypothetical protein
VYSLETGVALRLRKGELLDLWRGVVGARARFITLAVLNCGTSRKMDMSPGSQERPSKTIHATYRYEERRARSTQEEARGQLATRGGRSHRAGSLQ